MKFYFAPLEGLGGYIYRNAYQKHFKNIDRYFMPFVAPTQNNKFTSRELKDVCKENNNTLTAIPQILTNKSEHFLFAAETLKGFGYDTVNLNLGCPSATVVSKKKGSGFLGDVEALKYFLDDIFEKSPTKISIKTRLGIESENEFPEIMKVFNQYPVEELIIHPRTQTDYYKNQPHLEMFKEALQDHTMPIVYNGDIFTVSDYEKFVKTFPEVDTVMLGRGLLGNPNLISEITNGTELSKETLKAFHDKILIDYKVVMSGDKPVLFKMKELWFYMIHLFEEPSKYLKKIRKTQNIRHYVEIVDEMFLEKSIVYNGDHFHDIINGMKK